MAINHKYERNTTAANRNIFIEEYFSGPDVKIYLDGEETREISYIQYSLQEQLKPIYGYASRTYDDVAVGSRIIVGTIQVPLSNYAPNNFQAPAKAQTRTSEPSSARPGWAETASTSTMTRSSAKMNEPEIASHQITYYYAKSKTPLLAAPKDDAFVIRDVQRNEEFEIIEDLGQWLLIQTTYSKGYARKSFLL